MPQTLKSIADFLGVGIDDELTAETASKVVGILGTLFSRTGLASSQIPGSKKANTSTGGAPSGEGKKQKKSTALPSQKKPSEKKAPTNRVHPSSEGEGFKRSNVITMTKPETRYVILNKQIKETHTEEFQGALSTLTRQLGEFIVAAEAKARKFISDQKIREETSKLTGVKLMNYLLGQIRLHKDADGNECYFRGSGNSQILANAPWLFWGLFLADSLEFCRQIVLKVKDELGVASPAEKAAIEYRTASLNPRLAEFLRLTAEDQALYFNTYGALRGALQGEDLKKYPPLDPTYVGTNGGVRGEGVLSARLDGSVIDATLGEILGKAAEDATSKSSMN